MKFGTDVFISYAHQDDQAVPGEVGWVSQFEANLKAYLAKSYRREPRLWRDRRLRGNQDFDEEIQEQLLNSAVLDDRFRNNMTIVAPINRTECI